MKYEPLRSLSDQLHFLLIFSFRRISTQSKFSGISYLFKDIVALKLEIEAKLEHRCHFRTLRCLLLRKRVPPKALKHFYVVVKKDKGLCHS